MQELQFQSNRLESLQRHWLMIQFAPNAAFSSIWFPKVNQYATIWGTPISFSFTYAQYFLFRFPLLYCWFPLPYCWFPMSKLIVCGWNTVNILFIRKQQNQINKANNFKIQCYYYQLQLMTLPMKLTSEHTFHKYLLTVHLVSFRDTQQTLRKIRPSKIPQLQNSKSIQLKIAGQIIKFQKLTYFSEPNSAFQQLVKNTSIDIAFSTTLNKYYPIKSLIKIYESSSILSKQQERKGDSKFQTVLGVSGLSTESLIQNISPNNTQAQQIFKQQGSDKQQKHQNFDKNNQTCFQPTKAQITIKKLVSDIQVVMKLEIIRQQLKQTRQIINQQPKLQKRKTKSVRKLSQESFESSFHKQQLTYSQRQIEGSKFLQILQKEDIDNFKRKKQQKVIKKLVISNRIVQQSILPAEAQRVIKSHKENQKIFEEDLQLKFKHKQSNEEKQQIISDFTFRNICEQDETVQLGQSQQYRQPEQNRNQQKQQANSHYLEHRFQKNLGQSMTARSAFEQRNNFDQNMPGTTLMRSVQLSENCRSQQYELQQEINYYQEQLDTIGTQLIQERRKISKLQQKVMNFSRMNNNLKVENFILNNQIYQYVEYFKMLSDNISNFQNVGKNFQVDQINKSITILYKNQSFILKFKNFIGFIRQKLIAVQQQKTKQIVTKKLYKQSQESFYKSQNRRRPNSKLSNKQFEQMTKSQLLSPTLYNSIEKNLQKNKKNPVASQLENPNQQKQIVRLNQQCNKLEQTISQLRKQLQMRDAQIHEAYLLLDQKNTLITQKDREKGQLGEQVFFLGQRNKDLESQIKELNKKLHNQQQLINAKDQTIQHFDRLMRKQRQTIELLNLQKEDQQKKLQNFRNIVEENKQEIEDLNQKLQKYMDQYGQLKGKKNKILQKEIKDCIRWLDSKNRDQMDLLNINEPEIITQKILISPTKQFQKNSNQSETVIGSISSVIRSMQINGVPIGQITSIRDQLVKILEKVNGVLSDSKKQQQIQSNYLDQIKDQTSFTDY